MFEFWMHGLLREYDFLAQEVTSSLVSLPQRFLRSYLQPCTIFEHSGLCSRFVSAFDASAWWVSTGLFDVRRSRGCI